jgi:hypothetical protein
VGKPPEPGDNVTVPKGVFVESSAEFLQLFRGGVEKIGKDLDRSLLHRRFFRVFQGKIKKCPLDRMKAPVMTSFHPLEAESEGFLIAGIGFGQMTMNVAGKLIEEDDQGQPSSGVLPPMVVFLPDGPAQILLEKIADLLVCSFLTAEPELQTFCRHNTGPK